jgi:hypothetical protein
MSGAILPLTLYAYVGWCSVKAQGQLYLYLFKSLLNIWAIKSKRWAEHIAGMVKIRDVYTILVGNPEWKILLW